MIEEGYRLNVPLRADAIPATPGALPSRQSLFSVDRPGVYIESVKTADDGNGLIVRLYEGHGTRGTVTLSTTLPIQRAELVNLLEHDPRPAGPGVRRLHPLRHPVRDQDRPVLLRRSSPRFARTRVVTTEQHDSALRASR